MTRCIELVENLADHFAISVAYFDPGRLLKKAHSLNDEL